LIEQIELTSLLAMQRQTILIDLSELLAKLGLNALTG